MRKEGFFQGVALCICFGLIFVALLGSIYLPAIDSGFGGAKPRHAQFDLVAQDFGNETRALLILPAHMNQTFGIVATPKLTVYFSNSNFVLVKPLNQTALKTTVRIPMDSIRAITWID
jgi:hypothetical protein